MKELSIEEKAKAYDEAVINGSRLWESDIITRESYEYIFPELKESEDERIRNWLISTLKSLNSTAVQIDGAHEMMLPAIAWLEKQGKQKPIEWHREDEQNLNVCLGYIPDEFLRRWLMDVVHVKYDKPTDKVETKFNVGDWLQYRNAKPFFVEEITKQGYVNGDSCLPFNWENEIHLWTIQDAKDGDVLVSKDGDEILIFRNLDTSTSFSSYYNIQRKGELGWSNECFIPATKEQRDTLMKAMADAGYTFDFEKKELKKIEQKPVWSEEDETKIKSIIVLLKSPTLCAMEGNKGIIAANIKYLNSLKERIGNFDDGYKAGFSAAKHNQWKPSDEQMNALEDAIRYGEEENIGILSLLYNELKKLKGE